MRCFKYSACSLAYRNPRQNQLAFAALDFFPHPQIFGNCEPSDVCLDIPNWHLLDSDTGEQQAMYFTHAVCGVRLFCALRLQKFRTQEEKYMKTNTTPRTVFHTVRVTPDEAGELVEHAQACCISVSALMRSRVLGHPTPRGAAPAINLAAWRELASTAANFNQVSHKLNLAALSGEPSGVTLQQVKDLLIEMDERVKKLRLGLLGAMPSF